MDAAYELERIEALLRKGSAARKQTPKSAPASDARPVGAREALAPIAIVGIAGAFPKCASVAEFWRALQGDESLISEIGEDRFDWGASSFLGGDELASRCRWAGLIERPYGFDAEFFGLSAREAELMDPRQRLLLMSIYHCLEDAGYAPGSFKKSRTGLFIGAEDSEYAQTLYEAGVDPGLANAPSMLANRIAYHFDFAGPSEFVNTTCASGAVALHRACMALRCGEIRQAVVGAANVMVRPEPFLRLAEMGQLSDQSTVHSFGPDARGYLRADGVASVLLKTLSQAEEDGDAIYALIRHSAVNFSGQGGLSMATPNIAAHVNLIKQCYGDAGVDPRDVDYIEAQGMGTPVSDIAEWCAFNRALADLGREREVAIGHAGCRVSTLKPVLGHMHAASAFGALFKVILSLRSNTLYAIRGLTQSSPDLDEADQPCALLRSDVQWPRKHKPRLAGIHSYGIGGNNAHLLIEEHVAQDSPLAEAPVQREHTQVAPFSARSAGQCRALIERCYRWLKEEPEASLAGLAYTLQAGRDAFQHRVAFVAGSRAELVAKIEAYLQGEQVQGVFESAAPNAQLRCDSSDEAIHMATDWVQGAPVAWPLAGESARRRTGRARLHAPGYPFELKDYRISHESFGPSGDAWVRFAAIDADSSLSRREKIQRFITLFIARTLRVDPASVDPSQELQHLGVDSIVTVRLMRIVEAELGVTLSGRELRELSSIDSLALQIEKKARPAMRDAHQSQGEPGHVGADELENLEKFKRGELDLAELKELLG